MFAAALITLRETLEASLVVGIILAYLHRAESSKKSVGVWAGVFCGIALSFVLAYALQTFTDGFEGRTESVYEAITMLAAAGLLTWMILWMLRQRRTVRRHIEGKVAHHLEQNRMLGLFLLALVSTAREGIETVIFLQALLLHSQEGHQIFGGLAGILVAIGLSYFLFRGIEIIPLKKFFAVTSVLLILFAAGLVSHAIHALQEINILPAGRALWDLAPLLPPGTLAGQIFQTMFGYWIQPTMLEIAGYLGYLLGIGIVFQRFSRSELQRKSKEISLNR